VAGVLRAFTLRVLPADFGRDADFATLAAGRFAAAGFAAFAGLSPLRASLSGAQGLISGAAVSLDFFELFAIYFSFTSASLYAQSKPAQAEIGMKKASANSIRR
jgi:hypothetical protein